MAGTSVCLESGSVLDGKHGKYLLKDSIGSGGNGTVFSVDVIEGNELPWKGRYAIKVFKPGPDNRDYKKKGLSKLSRTQTSKSQDSGGLKRFDID